MLNKEDQFLPTSVKEMEMLGWKYADIIIFTGDAYVDHPSFGAAVIGRILKHNGYRVAIVPQPNWRDDLRDFKKLGRPRLFFGVTSGAMDSMINHYTANKRLRSNDAYTPDARQGQRPDYAVKIYSNILKSLYPDVPVVIGGIESSLRRLTHYDYWQNKLLPSILIDSKADIVVYGMGEKAIVEIAEIFKKSGNKADLTNVPQTAYIAKSKDFPAKDYILLNSFESCLKDKRSFINNFNIIEAESNKQDAKLLIEPYGEYFVNVNPPYKHYSTKEIDSYYELPYTKLPHPRYKGKHIPAYEMIKFSINTHRGCFGACSFCTISAHQGKFVISRSEQSILTEIEKLTAVEGFKGIISDVGGPTANMYGMKGINELICNKCIRDSCIYPSICKNLDISHDKLLNLYKEIKNIKGIKKSFIGSGIRYDLFLNENGYLNESGKKYFREVVVNHTSGRLKVAPEHTEEKVLKIMGKPKFNQFIFLRDEFEKIIQYENLRYEIVPYFISSHPGCRIDDMKKLSQNPALKGVKLEQVQDFTPTPMTRSSVSYYTGIDTKTGEKIFVERIPENKVKQKNFFLNKY